MKLDHFKHNDLLAAIKKLFVELNVPMNYLSDEPVKAESILKETYKDNDTFALIDDVYFAGMIDDAAFKGQKSPDIKAQEKDYDGILVFGLTLHPREHHLLPTRSQLAEISRAFNREFKYTPVVLIFKYHDAENEYLALANTERLAYQQSWREGEKAGKVSLLRDININKPHRGHQDIINELQIPTSGINIVDSFEKLYTYWQDVFSVSILNKKFYKELSNWYFWAIKHVTFPNKPTQEIAEEKGTDLNDLIHEHNATNIIRLLTRLLFVWFIKEKKLIPEELFDLRTLQNNILNELTPRNESSSLFEQKNYNSVYYRAILQNLFFASLNCPLNPDDTDKRSRQFRGDETYGKHRGVDWMMRYKNYFKDPAAFLNMINACVPFLNGGLFECLDDKNQNLYIDAFSDNMTKGEELIVPDYLFFGHEEFADLSEEYGYSKKSTKQAPVKGLIEILNSYKFTITENTPIEEDVALDPELLGKVFENLLASYNPETKTTARKQTGSFYTPREIVNYMVDESLIAYLKNILDDSENNNETLDKELHQLISYDPINPYENDQDISKNIIIALDACKILDPACGSGAFPMGILQKMVHVLQKLDPKNTHWKELQLHKALQDSEEAYEILDKKEREQKLIEINNAFDVNINDPDYARKLYLVENCIYGVDIQPIASQISKLRFFISLVVDQKVNKEAENFGIRPLPNLETKFVTANTLIGIEKPDIQVSLFETQTIKELEQELKAIRHKLFSAKTKETKLKYREKDKELRNVIADELKRSGWKNEAAEKLADWDPYDQNASSPFFDPEWMFDVADGFDILIGNPPYINANELKKRLGKYSYENLKSKFRCAKGTIDIYILFFEFGLKSLSNMGHLIFISPNRYLSASYGEALRKFIFSGYSIKKISDYSSIRVFEAASTYPIVTLIGKGIIENPISIIKFDSDYNIKESRYNDYSDLKLLPGLIWGFLLNSKIEIVKNIISVSRRLTECGKINATSTTKEADDFHELINVRTGQKLINTGTIDKYISLWGKKTLTDKGESYLNPYIDTSSSIISHQRNKLYQSNKIIIAKIGLEAEAFFDENGEYASINTNCIHSFHCDYSPKFITLWLNSSLFHFLFSCFFEGLKMAGGYLLYSSPNLRSTFIKKPNQKETILSVSLYGIVSWSLNHNDSSIIISVIDAFIFNVYFSEHMIKRHIDVLEYIEHDLYSVLRDRKFEKLNDVEKEDIIDQLNRLWTDPNNEVVKRMAQFKDKSPDILKPILES